MKKTWNAKKRQRLARATRKNLSDDPLKPFLYPDVSGASYHGIETRSDMLEANKLLAKWRKSFKVWLKRTIK